MKRSLFVLLLGGVLCACGSSEPPPDRLYPGPCEARWTNSDADDVTFGYDDQDRLATVHWSSVDEDDERTVDVERTYDDAGEPSTISWRRAELGSDTERAIWNFRADGSTLRIAGERPGTFEYEPGAVLAGFALDVDDALDPRSNDSLLSSDDGTAAITYVYDGPPRQGSRTRTSSDGHAMVFRYDDAGRLVHDPVEHRDYTYAGDRLTTLVENHATTTYTYDTFGNLLARNPGDLLEVTYHYGCW